MGWGMDALHIKRNKYNVGIYKDITIKVIISLLMAGLITFFIFGSLWNEKHELIHTILEAISICIGMSIFLILWNKQELKYSINSILGFGFFAVSIFDFMHIYYYIKTSFYGGLNANIAIGYWVIGRLVKSITILVFSFIPYCKSINKYFMMISTIISISFVSYIIEQGLAPFPVLYNENGYTKIKLLFECVVIIISIISLFKLRSNIEKEIDVSFKYLYISILISIVAEVCFITLNNITSFGVICGHVLKVFSYYFLYKSVFKGLIKSPYDRLRENNEKLSDILDSIPIAICTYNKNNEISFVNERFEQLFKCSRESLLGLGNKEVSEAFDMEVRYEDDLCYIVNSKEEDLKNIIRAYRDASGEEVNIVLNTHKINDGILVLLSDVEHEQEIENLNLQAQTILNSINVPTMIIDSEDCIVACNNYFLNLIDLDSVDINKISIQDLYEMLRISCPNDIDKASSENLDKEVEDWIIETINGEKRRIKATISEITNIQHNTLGKIFVFENISKRKEEELKLINQEKLALIGQMGATIVHETRNFLSTIKGNSQLIGLYAKDERVKQYAKKINTSTDEVNRIISDFLCLSKPKDAVMEEMAVCDLLRSMECTIETSSLMKGIEIQFVYNIDDRYILCDESQIRQVVLNISKNAMEAMIEVSKPKLIVESGIIKGNDNVYIRISDNGIGMKKETLEKIGIPFFTTKHSGTGLGLSVCYNIIKNHGGYIKVDSKESEGTSFTIVFPEINDDNIDDCV